MKPAAQRPVTLELRSGERVVGTLVHETPGSYSVQVEDRFLEFQDEEVVAIRYERGLPAAAPEAEAAPSGPVRATRVELPDAPDERARALRSALFPETPYGQLERTTFALLDGGAVSGRRGTLLTELLGGHPRPALCLYAGQHAPDLAAKLPHLVALGPDEALTRRLGEEGWGRSWGITLRSPASAEALVAHLRAFVQVADPRGRTFHFRFFDPRVLGDWLASANEDQVATFFGGAWVRRSGSEELECPLCDAQLEPLLARCAPCSERYGAANLGGVSPAAPFLIESVTCAAPPGDASCRYEPWPASFADGVVPHRTPRASKLLCFPAEQMQALRAGANRRALARWGAGHIEQAFSARAATMGRARVEALVRDGIARAQGYGLERNEDVARFLDVMFLWHPEFDRHRHGPFLPVLQDPGLSGEEKAARIWEKARRLAHQQRGEPAEGRPVEANDPAGTGEEVTGG